MGDVAPHAKGDAGPGGASASARNGTRPAFFDITYRAAWNGSLPSGDPDFDLLVVATPPGEAGPGGAVLSCGAGPSKPGPSCTAFAYRCAEGACTSAGGFTDGSTAYFGHSQGSNVGILACRETRDAAGGTGHECTHVLQQGDTVRTTRVYVSDDGRASVEPGLP